MNKLKTLDFIMASVIFIVAFIEPLSFIMVVFDIPEYLTHWYPVLNTSSLFVFSLYFLCRIIRYKSCIYTKIVVVIYFFIQLFNLLSILIKFGFVFYSEWIYPIFIMTICGIIQIKISRLFFYKKE